MYLVLVLAVLLNTVPSESRASSPSYESAASPVAVISPTPAITSNEDASLDTLLTESHERSAYLLPLIKADSSLLQGPKRKKERVVEIRPLHSKHGKDPVALILTSDIPVHRKPQKLHVILDSHGNRHKKKLYDKKAAKHYFFKPQSTEENYSGEGQDHSGYNTNEDFSYDDNPLTQEYNEGSYSSEKLNHKKKNYSGKQFFFHGYTSGENSQEESIEKQNKYSKAFKHYHSVSGDSSKHLTKHHYWNKYFSGSGSGSVESPSYEISKEDIVLREPQNYKEHTDINISDKSHSSSGEYPSFKIVNADFDHNVNNFEFTNESHSESNELHGYKDAEETVQNIQQSNQHKYSNELNELSGESSSYETSDEEDNHEISKNLKLISEESKDIINPVDTILILGKEQLAESLFAQSLTSELEESHGNTDDKLVILNVNQDSSSSKEQSIQDDHESFKNKEVASHSDEFSKSVESGNNNDGISKLINLVLGHDNHYHHHYHELNGQDSSDKSTVLYDTSESLNTEEYLNNDNDSKDWSGEILLPADHTHKHYDDTENHGSDINNLISQLLEKESSLDSSKQIFIHDLSSENNSIGGIIEVIKAPKIVYKKYLEDDCEDETVEQKSPLQKDTECHNKAHKTYKLSFRFN